MKKKILFICSNMEVGGFQKSLVSLLSYFDYGKYDVDLLLFNPVGIFMNIIPEQVNMIDPIMPCEYFNKFPDCVLELVRKRHFILAIIRLVGAMVSRLDRGYGAVIMSKGIPALTEHYDVIVDYNGQYILYYMIDKLNADKKITYFHNDYAMWPYYKNADKRYYAKADSIVTVSDLCVKSLKRYFPEYENRFFSIENIISTKTVNLFEKNSNTYQDKFNGIRIVTVGRVCEDKGTDFAVEACSKLKKVGYYVRWYVVGPESNIEFYNDLIEKNDVKNEFVFLGATNNPYDYIRNADIVVHPSRFEGKSVAIEEAKILCKPIVVTNFSTVRNQIENERTGLIVEMNSDAVYEGVKRLIDDQGLRFRIVDILVKECLGNENEIEKLYKLIED